MKILVTGATGNVGAYAARELIRMGEEVVVSGTDRKKLMALYGEEQEMVLLDFTKPETFQEALSGVDRVFLMRPPHLGKPEDLYPFIDYLRTCPIALISFLSLMGVEKNTIPPHHKIEKHIEKSGTAYAHIRPGFFMQNISGIHAQEIRARDEIFIPAGNSRTSFIDAQDIGLAVAVVLHEAEKYRNTAHTITGEEALDYDQIAEILSETTGRKIVYRKPGFLKYRREYMKSRGLDRKYVHVTMALYLMTRLGTAEGITEEFMSITGKRPRSFRNFAEANQECFRKVDGYRIN